MGSTKHACTAGRGSLPRPAEPLVQIWVALALIVSGVDRGERRGLESRIASINQHPIGIQSGSNRDPIGMGTSLLPPTRPQKPSENGPYNII